MSKERRRFIEEHPTLLTEGYTTTAEHIHGADYHWVPQCVADSAEEFEWRLVEK